jgi:pimeloyl-ACP methyl ester carboxylesterase
MELSRKPSLRSAALACLIVVAAPLPILAQGADVTLSVPRFEEGPCAFPAAQVAEQFRCGHLVVAENRSIPAGRTLRLAVAVLRSTGATPAADPLVFISGGPGSASVDRAGGAVRSPFRAQREMVFFDQRGTGRSEPRACDALNAEWERLTWLSGLDRAARQSAQLEALERCRAELRQQDVDLSQYNTVATVHDLEDLRKVLGYDSWNLWGLSYGSRVALEYLRVAPSAIRSVILDGPAPPNAPRWSNAGVSFAEALGRLMARCAADAPCAAAFPGGESEIWATVASLEREPMSIATGGRGGLPDTLVVDGTALAAGMLSALYSSRRSPIVPLLASEVGKRNEEFVLAVAPQIRRSPESLQQWVMVTVDCYESFPFRSAAASVTAAAPVSEALSRIGLERDPVICERWHPFRADAALGEPVKSDVPVLIITGEFDPATHRSYGPLAARTLTRAQVVEIPGGGHTEAVANPCTHGMMERFLADPSTPLVTTCLAELPPPRFLTDPRMIPR